MTNIDTIPLLPSPFFQQKLYQLSHQKQQYTHFHSDPHQTKPHILVQRIINYITELEIPNDFDLSNYLSKSYNTLTQEEYQISCWFALFTVLQAEDIIPLKFTRLGTCVKFFSQSAQAKLNPVTSVMKNVLFYLYNSEKFGTMKLFLDAFPELGDTINTVLESRKSFMSFKAITLLYNSGFDLDDSWFETIQQKHFYRPHTCNVTFFKRFLSVHQYQHNPIGRSSFMKGLIRYCPFIGYLAALAEADTPVPIIVKRNDDIVSVFHCLATYTDVNAIKTIIEYAPNQQQGINFVDESDNSPLDIALKHCNYKVAALFLTKGARLNFFLTYNSLLCSMSIYSVAINNWLETLKIYINMLNNNSRRIYQKVNQIDTLQNVPFHPLGCILYNIGHRADKESFISPLKELIKLGADPIKSSGIPINKMGSVCKPFYHPIAWASYGRRSHGKNTSQLDDTIGAKCLDEIINSIVDLLFQNIEYPWMAISLVNYQRHCVLKDAHISEFDYETETETPHHHHLDSSLGIDYTPPYKSIKYPY